MPVVTVQMWTGRTPAQKKALVRAITDAMVQHAGASQVSMMLSQRDDRLVLAVDDNGKGFDMRSAVPSPGIGLRTIREQVHALKGDLHLTSGENGTKLEISVPLEIRDDEA